MPPCPPKRNPALCITLPYDASQDPALPLHNPDLPNALVMPRPNSKHQVLSIKICTCTYTVHVHMHAVFVSNIHKAFSIIRSRLDRNVELLYKCLNSVPVG